jgi:hypothetical protein
LFPTTTALLFCSIVFFPYINQELIDFTIIDILKANKAVTKLIDEQPKKRERIHVE